MQLEEDHQVKLASKIVIQAWHNFYMNEYCIILSELAYKLT